MIRRFLQATLCFCFNSRGSGGFDWTLLLTGGVATFFMGGAVRHRGDSFPHAADCGSVRAEGRGREESGGGGLPREEPAADLSPSGSRTASSHRLLPARKATR